MSTKDRKKRKRAAVNRRDQGLVAGHFQHEAREGGTPVVERSHLQARNIFGKGPHSQPTRYGITSRMRRELNAYGVGAPAGE